MIINDHKSREPKANSIIVVGMIKRIEQKWKGKMKNKMKTDKWIGGQTEPKPTEN